MADQTPHAKAEHDQQKVTALHVMKQAGVPDAHLDSLSSLPEAARGAIDWAALANLVAKYGPAIITDLLTVFKVAA